MTAHQGDVYLRIQFDIERDRAATFVIVPDSARTAPDQSQSVALQESTQLLGYVRRGCDGMWRDLPAYS